MAERTAARVGVDSKGDRNLNYAFDTRELQALVKTFHSDLKSLDENLAKNDPEMYFVPLDEIASSIQY